MNNSRPFLPVSGPCAAPSIFAADFYNLKKAAAVCGAAKVDMIHYDVMDNHFVPNISFGAKLIGDINSKTRIPADVHLMIDLEKPAGLKPFLELPVDHITLHLESMNGSINEYIKAVKKSGKTIGLSIRPKTPVKALSPFLDIIDLVLLMSVEPGYSGQKFIPETLGRLKKLRELIKGRSIAVQVDGGINRLTYGNVLQNGADILVIGYAFFEDRNPRGWVKKIKSYSYGK